MGILGSTQQVEASWNVMAHAQKPDFVFRRNGRVHLNRRGCQFSRLLAAEVCSTAVVMLDTPCSEVVRRVLATHSISQFPLHFPSRASPCAITFQLESTTPQFTRGQEQILRPKRRVGALLRHQTMGKSQKLSNPVWNTPLSKLTSTTKFFFRYRPRCGPEGGECSAARPDRTLPSGRNRYPLYRRLGGPQGQSGQAENLVPTGIRSRTAQPVVSRNTDWATRPIPAPQQNRIHRSQLLISKFYTEKYVSVCSHDETPCIGGTWEEQCSTLAIVKTALLSEKLTCQSVPISRRNNRVPRKRAQRRSAWNSIYGTSYLISTPTVSNPYGHLFMLEKSISLQKLLQDEVTQQSCINSKRHIKIPYWRNQNSVLTQSNWYFFF